MIRDARIKDAKDIQRLIRKWSERGRMLPRSLNEIYEHIRKFLVFEKDGKVVGAISLHVVWENIAEIRSLVVEDGYEKLGVGRSLVTSCLNLACELGVKEVFALTYIPDFFRKMGFTEIDKQTLPHKIWSDCVRCDKFPDCDEVAVSITLSSTCGV